MIEKLTRLEDALLNVQDELRSLKIDTENEVLIASITTATTTPPWIAPANGKVKVTTKKTGSTVFTTTLRINGDIVFNESVSKFIYTGWFGKKSHYFGSSCEHVSNYELSLR